MAGESDLEVFDYIICGGGCAGLSLAFQLNLRPELKEKKILIIEKEQKTANDRTWCFWEKSNGPFEEIVNYQWANAWFYGPKFSKLLTLDPYHYKMIKADRFYDFARTKLIQNPNIIFERAEIEEAFEVDEKVSVQTNRGVFIGNYCFNSLPVKIDKKPNHHYLLQHFKGLVIKTPKPFFNPEEPVLMDFRIPQKNECRFMYVLPTSANEALVEFTIFSAQHLLPKEYDEQIEAYIKDFLKIGEYDILHAEFGSIPMFSEPFEKGKGNRILHIGTSGGQTKASTGYTFTRIQRHSIALANALANTGWPNIAPMSKKSRFAYYDNVLLHVLANNVVGGAKVFENLFRYNKPKFIFQFLDEDSNFLEEYRLMNTVPVFKFIGPGWKELLNLRK